MNASSEVASKPATDSLIEIASSPIVGYTPSANSGRNDSAAPETTLVGVTRDLSAPATAPAIVPVAIESAPPSAPAQRQSYGTQRPTSTTKVSLQPSSTRDADAPVTTAAERPSRQPSPDLDGSVARQAASSVDENNQPESFASEDLSAPAVTPTSTSQDPPLTVASAPNNSMTPNLTAGAIKNAWWEVLPAPASTGTRPSALNLTPGQIPNPDGNTRASEGPLVKPATASQPLRSVPEPAGATEVGRTASLTVQLAEGQTMRATVRQREGSIDVKIVTSSSAAAERVSSELDAMRQNFDTAGLQLGRSEVSYQQGGGRDRDGQQAQRESEPNPTSKEIFSLGEVVE